MSKKRHRRGQKIDKTAPTSADHFRRGLDVGRQQVADFMMAQGYATGHGDTVFDLLSELEGQAKERGCSEAEENT